LPIVKLLVPPEKKLTDAKPVQFLKAEDPIEITLAGIVIEVNLEQLSKAEEPIFPIY
jgi:hypothetical protein